MQPQVASSAALIGKSQRVLASKTAGRLAQALPRLSLKGLDKILATARGARLIGARKDVFAIDVKASVVHVISRAAALSSAGQLPSRKSTDRTVLALLQRTQDAADKAANPVPTIVARVSSESVRTLSLIVPSAKLLMRPSSLARIDRRMVRTVEDIHARAGAIASSRGNESRELIVHASAALEKIDARLAAVNRASDSNPVNTSGSEARLAQKNNSARVQQTDADTVGARPTRLARFPIRIEHQLANCLPLKVVLPPSPTSCAQNHRASALQMMDTFTL